MMSNLKNTHRKVFVSLIAVIYITIFILIYQVLDIGKIYHINLKIRIVSSSSPDLQLSLSRQLPYLPIEDLINNTYTTRNINGSCAWYPSFRDIKIQNNLWQKFQNTNLTYYIFGAYLDNRPTVVQDEPVVRILTMINLLSANDSDYPKTYCQMWYEEQRKPIIMPAKNLHKLWYYDWGHGSENSYGHFISCPLPNEHKDWIPRTVSLVSSPCAKATNNVRVTYLPLQQDEDKEGFAVCIKGLDYLDTDLSQRLVEYIESMRSLGASKIVMYNLQAHPNMTKVIQYYERTGYVEYRPLSTSLEVSTLPEYRHLGMSKNYGPYMLHEVIPYNDCLYRNMYRYKYVAVADIDEVLMPLGNFTTWHDLMQYAETINDLGCSKIGSFCFRCVYFPRYAEKPSHTNEFPEYFYMLQHVERVKEPLAPELATKCLHSTDYVIATHNHFPFHVTDEACDSYSFLPSEAQMQHYREPDIKETLNDPVVDTNLWRFKDEIIERSMKVFKEL